MEAKGGRSPGILRWCLCVPLSCSCVTAMLRVGRTTMRLLCISCRWRGLPSAVVCFHVQQACRPTERRSASVLTLSFWLCLFLISSRGVPSALVCFHVSQACRPIVRRFFCLKSILLILSIFFLRVLNPPFSAGSHGCASPEQQSLASSITVCLQLEGRSFRSVANHGAVNSFVNS